MPGRCLRNVRKKNWEQALKQLEDDIVFERLWNAKQKKEI